MEESKQPLEDDLLIRFILEQCSVEEARYVLHLIETDARCRVAYKELQPVWAAIRIEQALENEKPDKSQIAAIIKKIKKRKSRKLYYLAMGAAAAILFMLLFPFQDHKVESYEKALKKIANTELITLTTGGNESVKLQDSAAVISYTSKGQVIINDSLLKQGGKPVKNDRNVIHVPYGKRTTLLLSDGTKVYLNSGSSLIYPSVFESGKREVFLEGEAFFEVSREEKRRFVVATSYKSVEVLGTRFNVSIDKQLQHFETVLVSGKVQVDGAENKITLVPSQKYSFSGMSRKESLQFVDTEYYTSWINGTLKFNKEPLQVILRKLEKVYNIKVEFLKPEYKDYLISGSLNLRNTPAETLDIVMNILSTDYLQETVHSIE